MGPEITDHTFRILNTAERRGSEQNLCGYKGNCNQPRDKHITVGDFRAAKAAEKAGEE